MGYNFFFEWDLAVPFFIVFVRICFPFFKIEFFYIYNEKRREQKRKLYTILTQLRILFKPKSNSNTNLIETQIKSKPTPIPIHSKPTPNSSLYKPSLNPTSYLQPPPSALRPSSDNLRTSEASHAI